MPSYILLLIHLRFKLTLYVCGGSVTSKELPKKDALFLHMGPGLNSYIERKILSPSNPNILFWDQPLVNESLEFPFSELIDKTILVTEKLCQELQGPIKIIAHSFGGHIAKELLIRNDNLIDSCHFISTGHDILGGYLNLINQICKTSPPNLNFQVAAQHLLEQEIHSRNLKDVLDQCIGLITSTPEFMKLYWPKESQYERFARIAADAPPIDIDTFRLVLLDFLEHYYKTDLIYDGKVKITMELGGRDPLLTSKTSDLWSKTLPKVNLRIAPNSGHFLHLEHEIDSFVI